MADRWSPLISAAAGLTGVWKQRQYDLARRQLEGFLLAVLCPTGGDPRKRRDSRTGQYGGERGMDRGLCWSDRPRDQQEKLWLVEESTRKQYPVLWRSRNSGSERRVRLAALEEFLEERQILREEETRSWTRTSTGSSRRCAVSLHESRPLLAHPGRAARPRNARSRNRQPPPRPGHRSRPSWRPSYSNTARPLR